MGNAPAWSVPAVPAAAMAAAPRGAAASLVAAARSAAAVPAATAATAPVKAPASPEGEGAAVEKRGVVVPVRIRIAPTRPVIDGGPTVGIRVSAAVPRIERNDRGVPGVGVVGDVSVAVPVAIVSALGDAVRDPAQPGAGRDDNLAHADASKPDQVIGRDVVVEARAAGSNVSDDRGVRKFRSGPPDDVLQESILESLPGRGLRERQGPEEEAREKGEGPFHGGLPGTLSPRSRGGGRSGATPAT